MDQHTEDDPLAIAREALTDIIVALTGARGLLEPPTSAEDLELARGAVLEAIAAMRLVPIAIEMAAPKLAEPRSRGDTSVFRGCRRNRS
jgi:hypothetical protein